MQKKKKRRRRKSSKMRLLVIIIMLVCTVSASIVFAKYKEQNQVLAADNIEDKTSVGENKGGNVEIEKSQSETTNAAKTVNNEQAVSNNSVSKSNNIDTNYSKFFKKDVFMGDSVTEGLSAYDFLDEANVYAKLGMNLNQVDEQIGKAKNLRPQRIFLLFGLNDISSGITPATFKERYKNAIHKIKGSMPNSKIYIQSILPVQPQASKDNYNLNNNGIGQFNAAIQEMAKEENISYLNIASILNDSNKNLYQPDGIHFVSKFYGLWLNYLELNAK